MKQKSKVIAFFLWIFLGLLGIYDFYLKQYIRGIIKLISFCLIYIFYLNGNDLHLAILFFLVLFWIFDGIFLNYKVNSYNKKLDPEYILNEKVFIKGLDITIEAKQWIDEKIELLINKLGKDYLREKKNINPSDLLDNKELKTIISFILKRMDIKEKNENTETCDLCIEKSDIIFIGIEDNFINDPIRTIYFLVSKLCRIILEHNMLLTEDSAELVDLLTVFFGFGYFSSISTVNYKINSFGAYSYEWSIKKYGYLNQNIYGYIICSRDLIFEYNDNSFFKKLPSNTKSSYKKTKKYFNKMGFPTYFNKILN